MQIKSLLRIGFFLTLVALTGCRTASVTGVVKSIGAEPFTEVVLETQNGDRYFIEASQAVKSRILSQYSHQTVRVRGKVKKGIVLEREAYIIRLNCKR